jgi:hypothetical protein
MSLIRAIDPAMKHSSAGGELIRDAVFVYNTPLPDIIASIRVVALVPGRYMGLRVLHVGPGMAANAFLDRHRPSALILTKAFDDSIVELAEAAVARAIPLITTLCDLHFSGESGRRNRRLCDLSQAVIVQTGAMADEVMRQFGKRCAIIEEAIEYPREQASFAPGRPLKLLWYGHSANHDTLSAGIAALAGASLGPITFMIVSNAMPEFMDGGFPIQPKDMGFEVVPWSIMAQYSALAWCDMVFIPSSDTPDKRVKGHNRLVEAINAGRIAITHPLPQYRELSAYSLCDADYGESVRAALADPSAVLRKIEDGQRYIDSRFAVDVISEKWRLLFDSLLR